MTENVNSGNFLHNLLLFGRLLRGLGLDINPGRMMDLIRAFSFIDIGRKVDFYHSTRSLLVHRREDIALFDEAFDAFWRQPDDEWRILDMQAWGKYRRPRRPVITPPPLKDQADSSSKLNNENPPSNELPPVIQVTMTYSNREVLRRKDFSELSGEELEAIKRMMSELVWKLGLRRTRRLQPGAGARLDLRRTLRRNLKHGGEILAWARRGPKFKRRPLIILADISGSMERYTRLLLQFIYSLSEGLHQSVEAFVFSTRLTRITRQLCGHDVEQALGDVSAMVSDWSGGTRIGEALKSFNFAWGRRVLGQGAVVLLISDGWDRGDADLLQTEISRLQRSCHRLIWLNPLLGSDQYEPLTRGMRTALPYIDDFLPVHNLASLEDLAQHLERIDRSRPERRQFRGEHNLSNVNSG
jgi:uncharacterized protein with von Willebrand factor type A (vWA) domain